MLGFLDVFRSLMVLIIVLLPVVIFMRSGKGASGGMGH
jgi:DHA2 family multidrug resistance protein